MEKKGDRPLFLSPFSVPFFIQKSNTQDCLKENEQPSNEGGGLPSLLYSARPEGKPAMRGPLSNPIFYDAQIHPENVKVHL
jgi:hypothetical protein